MNICQAIKQTRLWANWEFTEFEDCYRRDGARKALDHLENLLDNTEKTHHTTIGLTIDDFTNLLEGYTQALKLLAAKNLRNNT